MGKMKIYWAGIASILLLVVGVRPAAAAWSVDIESGLAINGYNDVRIPGNTGTDFSLTNDLDADPTGFIRLRLTRHFGSKHQVSLLVAPLRIKAAATVNRTVEFNGIQFAANESLESRYRFDSYRLTYRYALYQSDRFQFGAGFTAKIRDAAIRVTGEEKSTEKTNTGFVPLINFALDWRSASEFGVLLQGDALAAPQGRAEDVLLALYGIPHENIRLRLGYRILEGGADNDEVYTFALVHYLSLGFAWSF